ncbi:hypothetical protein [Mariluticola halotolerans]|uniref:hypothetical protein n=1 Tax=Mariluticola halotolerans TaxID=2909283 RepID=UPI0026E1B626|nr:hypothetical protein [Mariluticola halotolerans]UJQ93613.1 hypothetical protein L1P08_11530 [Mariluticola halotolerans]
MKLHPVFAAAAIALSASLCASLPASAASTDSIYTDINLDECLVLGADDFGASFACPGYKGYPLWIAEGDLRFFVSYGFGAPDERAASQTLPAFNTIGAKMEWRLSNKSGAWKPFATILRWHTEVGDGSEPDGQILVVTKLAPGNTCHIGYVDAKNLAAPGDNANEIARNFADDFAEDFDCATDEPHLYPS